MMPKVQTYNTTGAKDPIALDYLPTSRITAAITLGTTGAFTMEVTLDEVIDQDSPQYIAPASARWYTIAGAPTAATGYVQIDGPWRAIRLNISALDTTAVWSVAQATTPRA
jgi:hypothetical protein